MQIALAGWSLVNRFREKCAPLSLFDFPQVAKEEFGLHAVELNNVFFASTEPDYLQLLMERAERAGVQLLGMAVDEKGDLASLLESARQEAVAAYDRWLPVAARLKLPFIRVNTGGRGQEDNPQAVEQCVKSLKTLAWHAEELGLQLAIENHGGLSRRADQMLAILAAVGSSVLGTLPDFGNFSPETRYEDLAKIAPYALAVHAKMSEFDEHGEDVHIDVRRCVRIMRDAGYSGYWAVEYAGKDDHGGVLQSISLLRKCLSSM